MNTVTEAKRETLNIRIKPEVRDLIDRAAKSRGKNRTDFILDSARLAAEDTLLDQVIMTVGIRGMTVHALSDDAKAYYEKIGFESSPIDSHLLMITLPDLIDACAAPMEMTSAISGSTEFIWKPVCP